MAQCRAQSEEDRAQVDPHDPVELLDVRPAPSYEQLATAVRARAREELFKTLKDGAGVVRSPF